MQLLKRAYTIFRSRLRALEKSSSPTSKSYQGADPFDTAAERKAAAIPEAVAHDLAVFEIIPPGSLKELKQKRKALLKEYHPDRFSKGNDETAEARRQTAKEITQLYNEAYERLVEYFSKNTEQQK